MAVGRTEGAACYKKRGWSSHIDQQTDSVIFQFLALPNLQYNYSPMISSSVDPAD